MTRTLLRLLRRPPGFPARLLVDGSLAGLPLRDLSRLLSVSSLLAVVAATLPPQAASTTWVRPQRPLSSAEWLEHDVSGADAVGIGQVIAVTDTVVNINPIDGSGFPVRSLTFRATKWLKGDPGVATVRAGTSPLDEDPLHAPGETLNGVRQSGRPVLFMMRLRPDGWVLVDGPAPGGTGLRLIPSGQATALEEEVRRLVVRQSVDSLLLHADLVVLGQPSGVRPCRSGAQCASIVIDSILAGGVRAKSVLVFTPLLGAVPDGQALYILRDDSQGVYEPLGHQAGVQAVLGGRTQLWKLAPSAIRERLQRLRGAGGR